MIKSISYSQQEIINNILQLHNNGKPLDFDPCYNVGGFYKNGIVIVPRVKSDINPLLPGVLKLDVRTFLALSNIPTIRPCLHICTPAVVCVPT